MRIKEIQYRAAWHLVEAVKLLKMLGEHQSFVDAALDKAQELKDQIVIDEEENKKIAEYRDKIRD